MDVKFYLGVVLVVVGVLWIAYNLAPKYRVVKCANGTGRFLPMYGDRILDRTGTPVSRKSNAYCDYNYSLWHSNKDECEKVIKRHQRQTIN